MKISPEDVGYWYLRLNGFLTIPNFIVHPDYAGTQLTDGDVLGVRFPHRAELLRNSMNDDPTLTNITNKPFFVLAEIKTGECNINRSLRDPNTDNVQRILRAIGMFPSASTLDVAARICEQGYYGTDAYYVSFCCIGDWHNENVAAQYPAVPQLLWPDVLAFIFDRFARYRSIKADHTQWDDTGKFLWNAAAQLSDVNTFNSFIHTLWTVR